jgi:K(+)-stimulated pyrophosphate-energized sodium pump
MALAVARALYVRVKKAPEGSETMARIARYVREGAMAFLEREYKVLAVYATVVFLGLWATLERSSPAPSCRSSPGSSG